MSGGVRILIATLVSALFLLIYDIFVIRPRVEKQKQLVKQSEQLHQESSEKEKRVLQEHRDLSDADIFIAPSSITSFSLIDDNFVRVIFTWGIIEKLELKNFKMKVGSNDNFYYDKPFKFSFFRSDGNTEIVPAKFELSGEAIIFFSDSLSFVVSYSKVSKYVFDLDIKLFGDFIDVVPIFYLRKSKEDDPEIVAFTPSMKNVKDLKVGNVVDFFGEKGRYFSFLVMPSCKVYFSASKENLSSFSCDRVISKGFAELKLRFFAGPKIEEELVAFNKQAQSVASFGFLHPISKFIVVSLEFINSFVGNLGFSIIILSLLVRLIFTPLNIISLKSMKKLKDIQPQIEKIKEKYKDDKERASREIFELYRREKINPFAGCLPMLIQIPIFIALYQALLNSIDLRHAPFVLWIKDLSSPETLFTLRLGGWAFEFHLLPVLMGATFLVQQLISPQTSDDLAFKLAFNYIMPIMFIFILWNAPAGLHLYWITMNILSILHQLIFIKK